MPCAEGSGSVLATRPVCAVQTVAALVSVREHRRAHHRGQPSENGSRLEMISVADRPCSYVTPNPPSRQKSSSSSSSGDAENPYGRIASQYRFSNDAPSVVNRRVAGTNSTHSPAPQRSRRRILSDHALVCPSLPLQSSSASSHRPTDCSSWCERVSPRFRDSACRGRGVRGSKVLVDIL